MAVFLLLLLLGEPSIFKDVTTSAGVAFTYRNGMDGSWYVPEEVGGGVALFDYDNDGDLDLYLVQADHGPLSGGSGRSSDRLFRNIGEQGQIRFKDVTEEAGIDARGYGMGVAVADVDGNGFLDLYLTNFGPNQLWLNDGKGHFRNGTPTSGADDPSWSTSASFFDMDRDGDPDLYVANYLVYTRSTHKACRNTAGVPDYCGPSSFSDAKDRLFRNEGKGRFTDISEHAGIHKASGSGLGVISWDANGDLFPDLYVANDADENFLWINDHKGGFTDEALLAGLAVNGQGGKEAGMGIARGDVDRDGDLDLLVTHLRGETHTLYLNEGDFFEDGTNAAGLAAPSLESTGFGTAFLDYDNDGLLDLLVVNGTVMTIDAQRAANDPWPMRQPNQLFRNLGGARFHDVSKAAGKALTRSEVSRGAAFGDLDNDGDTDVVIANNMGPARILRNEVGTMNRWLGVAPRATAKGPVVSGVRVDVTLADGRTLSGYSARCGSFLSSSDARVLSGLGKGGKITRVTVTWPDGRRERYADVSHNRYVNFIKGEGEEVR